MLLSIIVPVYNVEKYLERCVDSLLDQGEFTDYEIILVNDGSTDGSPEICEKYSAENDNVRVLHKENGGLSSARNAGIKVAEGDCIMFVDSDDYIKSECLKPLLKRAIDKSVDILSYNFSYIYDNYGVRRNETLTDLGNEVLSGDEYLIRNLRNHTMIMTAWKNLYKRELLLDSKNLFREGYVHEDEEWAPRIFHIAKSVCQYHDEVYGYYIREGSISNSAKSRKASVDLVENCKSLKQFCTTIQNRELKDLLENNIVTLALSAFYKGDLKDCSEEIISIIDELYVDRRNSKKVQLMKKSPDLYLMINSCLKKVSEAKVHMANIFKFGRKCCDFASQKIHKACREVFVCKKQRTLLKNHTFSIFSSTCNGGVITSELGEQFRSPTVNLWFLPDEYVKMISNLKNYMEMDVIEIKNSFYPYPVGKIGDVKIFFMHYHSFQEARQKWNERKERINYDNLYFMMAEKDGCTEESVRKFDELPYENKVLFTKKNYPNYKSAIWVSDTPEDEEVGVMTDFVGLSGRKYDSCLNYVEWLNGEKI